MKSKFEKAIMIFLLAIVFAGAGYGWRMYHEFNWAINYEYPEYPLEERIDFCNRLGYHGLSSWSEVYEDGSGIYFIRNGKRCIF